MRTTTFTLQTSDGVARFVHRWLPEEPVKVVVQIAHGWAEHGGRYARVAEALCREGYAVYANDHRGHGRTARTHVELGFFAERDGWNKCVDDPLCGGFESTVQLYIDIIVALTEVAKPSRQARIAKKLPIYIFSGSRDPVGSNIHQLLEAYRAAGLEKVTHKFYPGGRHESLNEINRDEVTRDLIAWLDAVVTKPELTAP